MSLSTFKKSPKINLGKLLCLIPDLKSQIAFLQVKFNQFESKLIKKKSYLEH